MYQGIRSPADQSLINSTSSCKPPSRNARIAKPWKGRWSMLLSSGAHGQENEGGVSWTKKRVKQAVKRNMCNRLLSGYKLDSQQWKRERITLITLQLSLRELLFKGARWRPASTTLSCLNLANDIIFICTLMYVNSKCLLCLYVIFPHLSVTQHSTQWVRFPTCKKI